jgi:hypothetical protein
MFGEFAFSDPNNQSAIKAYTYSTSKTVRDRDAVGDS